MKPTSGNMGPTFFNIPLLCGAYLSVNIKKPRPAPSNIRAYECT